MTMQRRARPSPVACGVATIAASACAGIDDRRPAPQPPDTGKRFATLRARAALIGYSLCTLTETDGLCFYLVSRWGMSRVLPDLAAVALFLRKVGAPE